MAATSSKQTISADGAQGVIAAAVAKANEIGVAMVIAVVDDSAQLKAFLRMDGALLASVTVSQSKAVTAVGFGLATDQWYSAIENDPPLLHGVTAIPNFMMIGGGVPLVGDGVIVGAVGVSGGSYQQDTEVAQAGAETIS
jgi:uncharacterized protein GlcG (DUF336 family)